jgi:hypothetical protein
LTWMGKRAGGLALAAALAAGGGSLAVTAAAPASAATACKTSIGAALTAEQTAKAGIRTQQWDHALPATVTAQTAANNATVACASEGQGAAVADPLTSAEGFLESARASVDSYNWEAAMTAADNAIAATTTANNSAY